MEKNIILFTLIFIQLIVELFMPSGNVTNAPEIKSANVQALNEANSKLHNYNRTSINYSTVDIELTSGKNIYAANSGSTVASKDNEDSKAQEDGHNIVTIEYKQVNEDKALSLYSQYQTQRVSRGQAANTDKKTEIKEDTALVIKNAKVEGGPGLYYKDMQTLKKGTKVTVIGKEGTWCLVEYNDTESKGKKRGYVQIKNMKVSNIGNLKHNKTQGITIKKTSVNGGPGKDYAAIGSLKKNEGVTILKEVDQWYFVEYNTTRDPNVGNKRGYVLKANVKEAHSIGDNLVNFVSKYEGYYSKVYICGGGKRTIGYGHVILAGESFKSMNKAEARELLKKDLEYVAHRVNELTSGLNLKQQEFDALVSFAFNVGEGGLRKSDLLLSIKNGERKPSEIRKDFAAWRKASGRVLLGLERRRYDEWEMFCDGDYLRDAHKKYK
jgi:lysozyme